MDTKELVHVIVAMLLLFVASSVAIILRGDVYLLPALLLFSIIVILVHVFSKKLIAYHLDASVEHRIWEFKRFGFKPGMEFNKPIPLGLILPLLVTFMTAGIIKFTAILTYETSALKYRAAKRHGARSYTVMTDWHNAVIGAFGIFCVLALSFFAYFPGWETLSKMAAYYAFWNMLPISKLDGTQIFFGNRTLWAILAMLSAIFTAFALLLTI